jgi:hypothetical protein
MKKLQSYGGQNCKLRDAAIFLGVRPLKLCDMIRNGEIEAYQSPHNETFLLWSDIDSYLTKRCGGDV